MLTKIFAVHKDLWRPGPRQSGSRCILQGDQHRNRGKLPETGKLFKHLRFPYGDLLPRGKRRISYGKHIDSFMGHKILLDSVAVNSFFFSDCQKKLRISIRRYIQLLDSSWYFGFFFFFFLIFQPFYTHVVYIFSGI